MDIYIYIFNWLLVFKLIKHNEDPAKKIGSRPVVITGLRPLQTHVLAVTFLSFNVGFLYLWVVHLKTCVLCTQVSGLLPWTSTSRSNTWFFFVFWCWLLIFGIWVDHLMTICCVPWIVAYDLEFWPQGQIPVFLSVSGLKLFLSLIVLLIFGMWIDHLVRMCPIS